MSSPCGRGGCCRPFVSELSALTAQPGFCGTRLRGRIERIASDLQHLGEMVAVTANTAAVMTRIGQYACPQMAGGPICLDPDATCVRLHAPAVGTALAVERMPLQKLPYSLQFYCAEGAVLHKSFLTDCRDDLDFARLTHGWESEHPSAHPPPAPANVPLAEPGDDFTIQTDSIFGDNGLSRRCGLPDWGEDWAWQVSPEQVFKILTLACDVRMPLTQMVGNSGVVQLHHGSVEKIRHTESLVMITAGCCTVSVEPQEIEEAWVTRYEHDGMSAHMLELYDWRFHCIARFAALGLDNPGLGGYWEQMVKSVPRLS